MRKTILSTLMLLSLLLPSCQMSQSQSTQSAVLAEGHTGQEFEKIIRERYACRSFDTRQISQDELTRILEAGRMAPTAKNIQEHHVYVVQSPEALKKLDTENACRYQAPTCLVVTYNKDQVYTYPDGISHSGVEDATLVACHMMLEAANIGLASCWTNMFDPSRMASALGIPETEQVVVVLDVGYASSTAKPSALHNQRKPLEETVTYL